MKEFELSTPQGPGSSTAAPSSARKFGDDFSDADSLFSASDAAESPLQDGKIESTDPYIFQEDEDAPTYLIAPEFGKQLELPAKAGEDWHVDFKDGQWVFFDLTAAKDSKKGRPRTVESAMQNPRAVPWCPGFA